MAATPSDPWTIARVIAWASADLKAHGSRTGRLDAELLLGQVLGCDRVRLVIDGQRPLAPGELGAYRALHKRRRLGEPVAYLRGEREFYGRPFVVDRRVLVPRPETEGLVEVALARTRRLGLCARVLDLCTGSGCVAVTLAKERPTTEVWASDVSADALDVARANALRLGARVGLRRADLYQGLDALRGELDLVTANPPYIPSDELATLPVDVREFEPRSALDGGSDGLALLRRLVDGARLMLAPGGVLAVEVGAGQAAAVRRLFAQAGFGAIDTARDYGGHERIVSAERDSRVVPPGAPVGLVAPLGAPVGLVAPLGAPVGLVAPLGAPVGLVAPLGAPLGPLPPATAGVSLGPDGEPPSPSRPPPRAEE
jgi:release factor glutamine methyltransferase